MRRAAGKLKEAGAGTFIYPHKTSEGEVAFTGKGDGENPSIHGQEGGPKNILYTDLKYDQYFGEISSPAPDKDRKILVAGINDNKGKQGESKYNITVVAIKANNGQFHMFFTKASVGDVRSSAERTTGGAKNMRLFSAPGWVSHHALLKELGEQGANPQSWPMAVKQEAFVKGNMLQRIKNCFGPQDNEEQVGSHEQARAQSAADGATLGASIHALMNLPPKDNISQDFGWQLSKGKSGEHSVVYRMKNPPLKDISGEPDSSVFTNPVSSWFDDRPGTDPIMTNLMAAQRVEDVKDLTANINFGHYNTLKGQMPAFKIFKDYSDVGDRDAFILDDPLEAFAIRLANMEAAHQDHEKFHNGQTWKDTELNDHDEVVMSYYENLRDRLILAYQETGGVDGMIGLDGLKKYDMPTADTEIGETIYISPFLFQAAKASIEKSAKQTICKNTNVSPVEAVSRTPALSGLETPFATIFDAASSDVAVRTALRTTALKPEEEKSGSEESRLLRNVTKSLGEDGLVYAYDKGSREQGDGNVTADMKGWRYFFAYPRRSSAEAHGTHLMLIPPCVKETSDALAAMYQDTYRSMDAKLGVIDVGRSGVTAEALVNTAARTSRLPITDARVITYDINGKLSVNVNIVDLAGAAKRYLKNPDIQSGAKYHFDDRHAKDAATAKAQADLKAKYSDDQEKAVEERLDELLTGSIKYEQADRKMRSAFLNLYKDNDITLAAALNNLGEFKFAPRYSPQFGKLTLKFDNQGGLYKISPPLPGTTEKVATQIPSDIFVGESLYGEVVDAVANAAKGNPSRVIVSNGKGVFVDQDEKKYAKAFVDWSDNWVSKVADLKREEYAVYLKGVAGLSTIRSAMGTMHKDRVDAVSGMEGYDVSKQLFGGADNRPAMEKIARHVYGKSQEAIKTYFRREIIKNGGMEGYRGGLYGNSVTAAEQKMTASLAKLQDDMERHADAWSDFTMGMEAKIVSDPHSLATLKKLSTGIVPQTPGMIDKMVNDIGMMVDTAWKNFTTLINVTLDAFTNFDRIYASLSTSFYRSFNAAMKTFFTVFWSDFTDNHFGNHRLDWARKTMHSVGDQVIGLKHLSQGEIDRIERRMGASSTDRFSRKHEHKISILSMAAFPHMDENKISNGHPELSKTIKAAFRNPVVTIADNDKGESYDNEEFFVEYQVANEQAAADLGYRKDFMDRNNYHDLLDWWNGGVGGKWRLPGARLFTPTAFSSNVADERVSRSYADRPPIKSVKDISFKDNGSRIRIRYSLRDIGLSPHEVYTDEAKKAFKQKSRDIRDRGEERMSRYQTREAPTTYYNQQR